MLAVNPIIKFVWLVSSALAYFTSNLYVLSVITTCGLVIFFVTDGYRSSLAKPTFYITTLIIIMYLTLWLFFESNSKLSNLVIPLIQIMAILFSSVSFFLITRPFELGEIFSILRLPQGLALSLGVGFRFIPIVSEMGSKIILAQRARGLHIGFSFKSATSIFISIKAIVIPLLLGAIRKTYESWLVFNMFGGLGPTKISFKKAKIKLVDDLNDKSGQMIFG